MATSVWSPAVHLTAARVTASGTLGNSFLRASQEPASIKQRQEVNPSLVPELCKVNRMFLPSELLRHCRDSCGAGEGQDSLPAKVHYSALARPWSRALSLLA